MAPEPRPMGGAKPGSDLNPARIFPRQEAVDSSNNLWALTTDGPVRSAASNSARLGHHGDVFTPGSGTPARDGRSL